MRHDLTEQQAAPPSVGGHPRSVAGGSGATADAFLGIYTKSYSAPSGTVGIDEETGEVIQLRTDGKGNVLTPSRTPEQTRAERFALKSVVNKLFPDSRMAKCYRQRAPHKDSVELKRGMETGKAYFHNLYVCGSIWGCPICWAKISERRKVELQAAIASAEAMGWKVYLVTLTVPHGLGDDLPDMLDKMEKAARKLTSDRSGVAFRKSIGLQGTVRAWEVTDGDNGFHPHFHFLYFLKPMGYTVSPLDVEFGLTRLWQQACVKVGLPCPSDTHGCRVDDGKKAAAYVSKGNWGLESEMTKGHTKTSKSKKGKSMSDLLRAYLADKSDKRSAARFVTYFNAFKGKRQLVWSKGLKQMLAVVEKSDEQIAQEQTEDPAIVLAQFTDDQWRHVYKMRLESTILDLAEKHPEAIPDYLRTVFATGAGERAGRAPPTRTPPGDGALPVPSGV